ncbi:peroxisomal membrane protein PEX14 isoform X1 [Engystomops pustulosus]|uniref:peroxisomal membrane protein PEX14 isoform X1 n=1 Tax=Engystomops pustulosus TaxID=76066 RepID=UPI003AFB37F5
MRRECQGSSCSRLSASSVEISRFLDSLPLWRLTPAQSSELDAPLSAEEVELAIQSLPPGKTPGLDGLGGEWYRDNCETLVPLLLSLYSDAFDSGSLPDSMREALIVVLPKPGKDPLLPDSYRPISLLNSDVKILAKILATRLNKVILSLVHPDQTGFMPGRGTDINIQRLHLNIAEAERSPDPGFILSLDNCKAFDSVEWTYLWTLLPRMGFGPRFTALVKLLYNDPKARVRTNLNISPTLPMARGTRQGCPLSPLLFALAIEPLAVAIRHSEGIKGITRGTIIEKVSLYADDTLVYLGDVGPSLESLLSLIERYGGFSGLRVNWDKSALFPLSDVGVHSLPVPVQVVSTFKYLGVQVSRKVQAFTELNITPLITATESRLKAWSTLPLSLYGRINIFKMIFLPKFLYLFHACPILLPKSLFKRIDGILRSFYWQCSAPRFSLALLQAPKARGGLAAPDLYLYYLASQLVYAQWWIDIDMGNAATALAGALVGSYEALTNLLYRYKSPSDTPLPLRTVAVCWRRAQSLVEPSSSPPLSPRTPLWLNPWLSHFLSLPGWTMWGAAGVKFVGQLLSPEAELLSFNEIRERHTVPTTASFHYTQLRHAFKAQFGSFSLTVKFSKLETLMSTPDLPKPLTQCYALLQEQKSRPFDRARERWRQDIPDLSDDDWREVELSYFTSVVSARDFLIQSKFLHRVYFTPARLFRMGAMPNDLCFRCQAEVGSFLHCVWSCPRVHVFWSEVLEFLNVHFDFPRLLSPSVCLLGIINEVINGHYDKIFFRFVLYYARKVVVMTWKDQEPPPLKRWILLINSVIPHYRSLYTNRKCPQKFDRIWSRWCATPHTAL